MQRRSPKAKGRDEGWSNAALLAEPFEGGDFDDGFVEAHWRGWAHAEARRRGGGEMSVGALGTLSPRSAFFCNAPSWGVAFPGGAGWSDDLMTMCEGERPVDCEG